MRDRCEHSAPGSVPGPVPVLPGRVCPGHPGGSPYPDGDPPTPTFLPHSGSWRGRQRAFCQYQPWCGCTVAVWFQLFTFFHHIADDGSELLWIGDRALNLTEFSQSLFGLCPLLLGTEGEFGGDRAELTVFRIVGFGLVVVFLGTTVTKEVQMGAGEEVVHNFLSFLRRVITFLYLIAVGGSGVDGAGDLAGERVLVYDRYRTRG
jgi:hypothetical protein